MLPREPVQVRWIDIDLPARVGIAALLELLPDREVRGRAAGLRTLQTP